MVRTEQGQALVEWCLSLSVLLILVGCATALFQAEWDRCRCSWKAFQDAHDQLIGKGSVHPVSAAPQGTVRVTARCGKARETVELQALEQDTAR